MTTEKNDFTYYAVVSGYILTCLGIFTGLSLNVLILFISGLSLMVSDINGYRQDLSYLFKKNGIILLLGALPWVVAVSNGVRLFTSPMSELSWSSVVVTILTFLISIMGILYITILLFLRIDSVKRV